MQITRFRPLALALLVSLAAAFAASELAPRQYVATGSVMTPASRLVKIERVSADPDEALRLVQQELRGEKVFDAPSVLPARSHHGLYLVLGGGLGLALGGALVWRRERARRPVRRERDLLGALGDPLLAARPAQDAALRELCRQLLEHWFVGGRTLLPVVSAGAGEGRTRIAARLAEMFSQMGVRTLLVDADLRASGRPRAPRFEMRAEHLAVASLPRTSDDPLEQLAGPEVPAFVAAAAKRFRVVLVDTPAAARGPDLQIFAALAGGALVIARERDMKELSFLRSLLEAAKARIVATVFTPS